MNLDRILAELAADPFEAVDLAEVSLLLAQDEYPTLNIPEYLQKIHHLAEQLQPRIDHADTLEGQVVELTHFLFEESAYFGNSTDYYDPKNSYLSDVIDRKLGIPISLTLLAMAVGNRCKMTIVGVGLPGHFIAKAIDMNQEIYFDPFHHGQLLDLMACEDLVKAVTGMPFVATEDTLAAVPPGLILQRMLNNLKMTYLRQADFQRAARIMLRLMQLDPTDLTQQRDLGIALVQAEQPGPALKYLEAYLETDPPLKDRETVKAFLKQARKQISQWN